MKEAMMTKTQALAVAARAQQTSEPIPEELRDAYPELAYIFDELDEVRANCRRLDVDALGEETARLRTALDDMRTVIGGRVRDAMQALNQLNHTMETIEEVLDD